MNAWGETSTPGQHAVYTGVWTNWSHGRILGSTLTLTQRDGNLLIAFAAFFTTLVATRVWRTICFFSHRYHSTSTLQDTLHHQRQVLLRNSASPQSGLWSFLQLVWASRSSQRGHVYRNIPIMLLAMICIGGFTMVTYFIPCISSSLGDEVLLRPGYCGVFEDGLAAEHNPADYETIVASYFSEQVTNAANYAQQCYSDSDTSGSLDCAGFVTDRVSSTVNKTAGCPFASDICRSNTTNILISTNLLDTNDVFGINSPPDERVLFRSSLHCSPLITEGRTSSRKTPFRNLTTYHYGSFVGLNYDLTDPESEGTTEIEDIETQYHLNEKHDSKYALPWNLYRLDVYGAKIYNGSVALESSFVPSADLRRYDADLSIVFLSGNGVIFPEPASDDWYRATRPLYRIYDVKLNGSGTSVYGFEDAASPLACVHQYQFCHTSLTENNRCGPFGSLQDSIEGILSIATSDKIKTQLYWFYYQFGFNSRILESVTVLGPQSLTSQRQLSAGIQGSLKENQWQLDVIHWWATFLAQMQSAFVKGVVGPGDARLRQYTETHLFPEQDNATYQNICQNQKIRDSSYMNFSMFGTCFLFITGGLMIAISFVIEPIYACLYSRRKYKEYAYIEWVTHSSLQLHRLAQEEVGWGTWSGTVQDVPTTQIGERLGCLDLEDSSHPKLCRPPTGIGNTKESQSSEQHTLTGTPQANPSQKASTEALIEHGRSFFDESSIGSVSVYDGTEG